MLIAYELHGIVVGACWARLCVDCEDEECPVVCGDKQKKCWITEACLKAYKAQIRAINWESTSISPQSNHMRIVGFATLHVRNNTRIPNPEHETPFSSPRSVIRWASYGGSKTTRSLLTREAPLPRPIVKSNTLSLPNLKNWVPATVPCTPLDWFWVAGLLWCSSSSCRKLVHAHLPKSYSARHITCTFMPLELVPWMSASGCFAPMLLERPFGL